MAVCQKLRTVAYGVLKSEQCVSSNLVKFTQYSDCSSLTTQIECVAGDGLQHYLCNCMQTEADYLIGWTYNTRRVTNKEYGPPSWITTFTLIVVKK